MLTIVLTGGIGSGKSTAGQMLKDLGVTVIDADDLAREVVQLGQPVLKDLGKYFDGVINEDGTLNRRALRNIVFSDSDSLTLLNSLTHPAIHDLAEQRIAEATGPYVVLITPLISGSSLFCLGNRIALVLSYEEDRIDRVIKRDDVDEDHVQSIIDAQMDPTIALNMSEYHISNSGDTEDLKIVMDACHRKWLELSKEL